MKPLAEGGAARRCWETLPLPTAELLKELKHGALAAGPDAAALATTAAVLRRDQVTRPVLFIGTGTCGLGAGAGQTLSAVRLYLGEKKLAADVIEVGCIGPCAMEPLLDVQLPGHARLSFCGVTGDKVVALLDAVFAGQVPTELLLGQFRHPTLPPYEGVPFMDEHPFFKPQRRWVLAGCGLIDPNSMDEYIAGGGYAALLATLRTRTPAEVCDAVEKSGLRGRGGGGFPTGTKWKLAAAAAGTQKYLVCNADEGDPGAFMDRALIEGDPHRLLEGMAIAAYAIGASKAYIYIRAEYPLAVDRLKIAIAQAKQYGFLGHNLFGSGFDLDIVIKMGAGAFVCGEETALLHSIEGKRGMPRPRPPYPAVDGLFHKPTVINNVETLATLPIIMTRGWEQFAAVGTKTSKGTKIFALSGKVVRTGLVEVDMGTTMRSIVFDVGGGSGAKATKAVQIGGPSGGCIPTPQMDIQIDYESLKAFGAIMGSGGLVVMDEDNCMVDVAKFFMQFIQRESCGKCIPCREGTRRILQVLEAITRGRRGEEELDALLRFQGVVYLEKLARVIKTTSLCGLGQTAPNPVLSTLRWFRHEYEAHIFDRKCPAKACADLLTYSIDAEKCVGCTLCAKKCPMEAIMGAAKSPHYIVVEKCTACGTCVDTCRHGAVLVA